MTPSLLRSTYDKRSMFYSRIKLLTTNLINYFVFQWFWNRFFPHRIFFQDFYEFFKRNFPILMELENNFSRFNSTQYTPVCHPLPGQTCQRLASSPRAGWWSWTRPRRWSGWWRGRAPAGGDSGMSPWCCRPSHRRLSSVWADLASSWSQSSSRRRRRRFSAGPRRWGRSLQTGCVASSPCGECPEARHRCLVTTRGLWVITVTLHTSTERKGSSSIGWVIRHGGSVRSKTKVDNR